MALRSYAGLAAYFVAAATQGGCVEHSLAVPEETVTGGPTEPPNVVTPPTTPENPTDMDHDGVPNSEDNCPTTFNPDQSDRDHDGVGDVCDDCPDNFDPEQTDDNNNGIGDACEPG
jgi:hypothetical protein